MTIKAQPLLCYENYADLPSTVLTSEHVATGSSVVRLLDPNMGRTLRLASGSNKKVLIDLGSSKPVGFFGLIGISLAQKTLINAEAIVLTASENSDLSSPELGPTSFPSQSVDVWPNGGDPRNKFRTAFDAVTSRYWQFEVVKSAVDETEIARLVIGPAWQPDWPVNGRGGIVKGIRYSDEDLTEEETSDGDIDLRFARSSRRTFEGVLTCVDDPTFYDEFYPGFSYAVGTKRDWYWCLDPTETSALRIQLFDIWGNGRASDPIKQEELDWWERELKQRERL